MISIPETWFGSEAAYLSFLTDLYHFNENPQAYDARLTMLRADIDEEMSLSEHLALQMSSNYGSTRVINIEGPMHQNASLFDLVFGGTSYESINQALSMAVEDDAVDNIVLSLATPGGAASGIFDLAEVIQQTNKIKPVVAHNTEGALSAGYIIGSSARQFRTAKLAEAGSIGAISTFTSVARRLKEDGIDVHVFRSGKNKALAHPAEELSDEAKASIQKKTQFMHGVFIDHVLKSRPSLAQTDMAQWAEGDTYFGEEAVQMGLVDGPPISLGQLLDSLQPTTVSKSGTLSSRNFSEAVMPITLSESARAALASGAELNDLPHAETDETETAELSAEAQQPEVPAEETDEAEPEAAVEAAAASGSSELTAYLQSEIRARDERVETLLVELAAYKAQITTLSAVEDQLKPIAVKACQRMQVALGQSAGSLESLSTAALVERYSELENDFNARFKVGQVSKTETEQSQTQRLDPGVARLSLVQGS